MQMNVTRFEVLRMVKVPLAVLNLFCPVELTK